MSDLGFTLQRIVGTVLGYCIATFIMFSMVFRIIRSPVKFVKKTFLTKRKGMPACLNDPSLGTHGFVHLEEVKLHYVACGDEDKPLMLCLHGFPEFWYSWRHQIREFSKDYRVVAVDMRGYGDSDKPSGYKNYVIEKLSADIKQLIPALGYKSCVLMAHDWGGAVAWNFATVYGDMVEKLIIFNCPHPGSFAKYLRTHSSQFKKSWYMLFFQVPYLPELLLTINDYASLEKLVRSLPNQTPSQDDIDAYKYAFSKKGAVTGPINYYRAAFSRKVEYTEKIHMPTLVVWGDPDVALETELAYLAKEYTPNLTVKVIKDSCHFVMIDKPEECNDAVREFLDE